MALSFCSNWGSSVINPATETELFGGDLNFYSNTETFVFSDQFLDQQLAADYDNHLLYFDTNPLNLISFPSDNLVPFDSSYQYIKRRKSFEEDCVTNFPNVKVPCFFDGFDLVNSIPAAPTPEFLLCSFPEIHVPAQESVKKSGEGRSVSPQSMAARQRRKKITEKTQELGKLVPGGTKMNTAEMFHAASKYVKWLQAQVAILQLMTSIQEEEEKPIEMSELKILLGTSMIQEKLYSEGKCLVPKKFVEDMANDKDIQSKPWIAKDIDRLLQNKD